jgi:hypothetical protein
MGKIQLAIQIAKIVLFLFFGLKDLVLQAEEQVPEKNRGSEKFAAVKAAIAAAASVMGIAEQAVKAADKIIEEKINETVEKEING